AFGIVQGILCQQDICHLGIGGGDTILKVQCRKFHKGLFIKLVRFFIFQYIGIDHPCIEQTVGQTGIVPQSFVIRHGLGRFSRALLGFPWAQWATPMIRFALAAPAEWSKLSARARASLPYATDFSVSTIQYS